MKKVLALALSLALIATLAISTTVAYLTSEDSDVNVMTLGNVKIEQHEKERKDMTHQDQQIPAELKDWEVSPLYPAVYTKGEANDPIAWQPGVNADEAYVNYGDFVTADITGPHWTGVWDSSLKNVKDKMVFVENTGTSDLYYRTIILYEYDETESKNSYGQDMIHFNTNGNPRFDWKEIGDKVTVNGEVYGVMVATYNIPLKPNTVSRPSLLQVGLDGDATNEIVEQFGDTYDILVLSQAVQTAGFADAESALKAGFGEVNSENIQKWFGGMEIPTVVSTAAELADALAKGGNIMLGENIQLKDEIIVSAGTNTNLDLNGKTIDTGNKTIKNNGILTITNGKIVNNTVNGTAVVSNSGEMILDGAEIVGAPIGETGYPSYAVTTSGKLTVEDGTSITSDRGAIFMNDGAEVVINGGNIKVTDALGSRILTAHVIYAYGYNSKLTIHDGTFAMNYAAAKNTGASVICPAGATIKVYDGDFRFAGERESQSGIFQNYMGYGAPVDVYGGTYNDDTVTKSGNLADGYQAVEADGIWTVSAK